MRINVLHLLLFAGIGWLLGYAMGYQQTVHSQLQHDYEALNLSVELNQCAAQNLALQAQLQGMATADTTNRQQAALNALCYTQYAGLALDHAGRK